MHGLDEDEGETFIPGGEDDKVGLGKNVIEVANGIGAVPADGIGEAEGVNALPETAALALVVVGTAVEIEAQGRKWGARVPSRESVDEIGGALVADDPAEKHEAEDVVAAGWPLDRRGESHG